MDLGNVGGKEKFTRHVQSASQPDPEGLRPDYGPEFPAGTFRLQQSDQDESHPQGDSLNSS